MAHRDEVHIGAGRDGIGTTWATIEQGDFAQHFAWSHLIERGLVAVGQSDGDFHPAAFDHIEIVGERAARDDGLPFGKAQPHLPNLFALPAHSAVDDIFVDDVSEIAQLS